MANGRIARRLAVLLGAAGYTVEAFYPAKGAYRTDVRQDCYRWSAAAKTSTGFKCTLDSWYTMTELVKAGSVHIDNCGEVFPGPSQAQPTKPTA